ncbi:MAG: 4Fe-4S binding protein [Ignavibacteriales bacterium]|nr:4Fe-4S binding protein [Ignavibacteriales bacterium]
MIYIRPGKCDYCGCCVGVCPEDAIELMESFISIIEERCTNCKKCVWACPWEVIEFHRDGIASLPTEISARNELMNTLPGS